LQPLEWFCRVEREPYQREKEELEKFKEKLDDPSPEDIADFIDNEESRREMLSILAEYELNLISGFLNFFSRCIDETWKRAAPPRAFFAYNENLRILLDILTSFDVRKMPAALFQLVAYSLDRVLEFVGEEAGKSWEAHRTWTARKSELSKEAIEELYAIAQQSEYAGLEMAVWALVEP
jgi:hypothetical protein